MADRSETSLDSSVTGKCKIYGRKIDHTFLVFLDVLIRLDLRIILAGKTLGPGKNDNNQDVCAVESSAGLAPNTDEEQKHLEEFIKQEMDKFEKVTGITPLLRYDIILENPTPIKQVPSPQPCNATNHRHRTRKHARRPRNTSVKQPLEFSDCTSKEEGWEVMFLCRLQETKLSNTQGCVSAPPGARYTR